MFFPLLVASKTERGKVHTVKLCFLEEKDLEGHREREYLGGGGQRSSLSLFKSSVRLFTDICCREERLILNNHAVNTQYGFSANLIKKITSFL